MGCRFFIGIAVCIGTTGCFMMLAGTAAEAGNRDSYTEVYKFDKPTNGISGNVGSYYCDYQKLPNLVCTVDSNGRENCRRDGWLLVQHCY